MRSISEVHILGVRHHGPGSARAVSAALAELDPDLVLVEGPPELDQVVAGAGSPAMVPPVAGLVYAVDRPRIASFYPMAVFSPEWVALRWAMAEGRSARFLDLPAANSLSQPRDSSEGERRRPPLLRDDPLGALAAAGGFDDTERWWEDAVEHRYHGLELFAVLLDAMAALREADEGPPDETTLVREAAMRRVLRGGMRSGAERIAVVCGAWHAPVLAPAAWPTQSADAARLKGLPAIKVAATWVPWTSSRLTRSSGYGAGVTAPGWYHHLFTAPDEVALRWLVGVATLLRGEQLDVSPAAVIEAVRLAEALATMRGRPMPGLDELMETARAVLCGGSAVPLELIAHRLLIGDDLGQVPDDTPMVPLARDLAGAQKRLRLKVSADPHRIELDLRRETHLERSKLFHRLLLLDVPWAQPVDAGRSRGTFREAWVLQWRPEFDVALIEASGGGTTVEGAATGVLTQRAGADVDVAELSRLVEAALLADLPDALDALLAALDERAARQHDTTVLMAAVEPLARIWRYGSVRRADTGTVHRVLAGVVARVAIGLPAVCTALDDESAARVRAGIDGVQRGIGVGDDDDLRAEWQGALTTVAGQRGVHGTIAGRVTRLLLDGGRLGTEEVGRRLSIVLSPGEVASQAAGWLEGFLDGDATLLIHQRELLAIIDTWVSAVAPGSFDSLLPLLRRSFSAFSAVERRDVGERVRRLRPGSGGSGGCGGGDDDGPLLDRDRAARVLPRLLELLGNRS